MWIGHLQKLSRYGLVAGVAFRLPVTPLVLGLGWWFLEVLGAPALTHAAPIDSKFLVVFSMRPPIGIGMCWAWV